MSASYLTIEAGCPVEDRFGEPVGRIKKVLVTSNSFFDGIIIETKEGDRFVDAPEVRKVALGVVELAVTASDVAYAGPKGPPGPREIHGVRRDRVSADEEDRLAAVRQLKEGFIAEEIDLDALERRLEAAHHATRLDELESLLADLS